MRWLSATFLSLALAATGAQAQDTAAEVRKIDKAQAKITLKHGEIRNLDMPPMTMVFRVREARMLDAVAVGDKVKVSVEKIDGQYTVTQMVKAP